MLADMRRTEGSLRVAMKQMQESENMPDDFGLLPSECFELALLAARQDSAFETFYNSAHR
jgi:hypothetical protein